MLPRDLTRAASVLALAFLFPLAAGGQQPRDAPLPPGHPTVAGAAGRGGPVPRGAPDDPDDEDAPLPPGHPQAPSGGGGAAQGSAPAMFDPPPDTETEDASLPKGSIVVELRDPDNDLLPGVQTSLGILHQSVAKGESREHKMATSDAKGLARFDDLESGSGIAYRVTVGRDGATFAAMPFQLPEARGMHVVLHVYPVSRSLSEALVVLQGIFFVEVEDDRIVVEQVYSVFNLGKIAWVPEDVILKLPPTFTALSSQQTMSDQGIDSVDKVGGRLHGTFAPGRHEINFHWQLPYSGEENVDFELGLPPHVAVMRAMAGASTGVRFSVVGFPDAEAQNGQQGQRVLVTEKQARRDEPWSTLHVKLDGLPTPGPARYVATGLAGLTVAVGLVLAFGGNDRPTRRRDQKARRSALLAEFLELEKARKGGDVGPKTYERARRELIDAIASTLEGEESVSTD